MNQEKQSLILFNLSMDLDNPVLATTNLWVNEFAKNFNFVYVYSTHVGRYEIPSNVKVTELGGGTTFKRVVAIWNLTKTIPILVRNCGQMVAFHHQSPRTAVYPGVLIRFLGIPQGLWYSHSKRPISLTIGSRMMSRIFSSTIDSLPLITKKGLFLGHGIDSRLGIEASDKILIRQNEILFVGRLDPIKRLEECIAAIQESNNKELRLIAIGPTSEGHSYIESLIKLSKRLNVEFRNYGPIPHDQVFFRMASSKMYFSGMRNSVDKSSLEASSTGCFVITTDIATAKLSGMTAFWEEYFGVKELPTLATQINLLSSMDQGLADKASFELQERSVHNNSASALISRISKTLKDI